MNDTDTTDVETDAPASEPRPKGRDWVNIIWRTATGCLLVLLGAIGHSAAQNTGHFLPGEVCWSYADADGSDGGCMNSDQVHLTFH